jgi:hypothetical protein
MRVESHAGSLAMKEAMSFPEESPDEDESQRQEMDEGSGRVFLSVAEVVLDSADAHIGRTALHQRSWGLAQKASLRRRKSDAASFVKEPVQYIATANRDHQ